MRKFLRPILLLFVILLVNNVSAMPKNDKSSTDEAKYYGSIKGGFSLSVGVLPLINFVGNMFNGTTNQSFSGLDDINSANFNGSVLSASYFVSNKVALTAGVGFNCNGKRTYSYGDDDTKESVKVTGTNEYMVTVGANYLLRPGSRLQPIIGGSLMYGFVNKNFEKTNDQTSMDADFNHKAPSSTFGVICNVGVEFFLCKAVSISAIADLALTTTINKTKVNDWDEQKSTINSKQTQFATGKFGGDIGINFYF